MIKFSSVPYAKLAEKVKEIGIGEETCTLISVCPAPRPGWYLLVYDEYPPPTPLEDDPDPFQREDDTPNTPPLAPGSTETKPAPSGPPTPQAEADPPDTEDPTLAEWKPGDGIRPLMDRAAAATRAFFKGDDHLCRSWLLEEFPGLDPTQGTLAQLSADDLCTILGVLETNKMDAKVRAARRRYRELTQAIHRLKPNVRISSLLGQYSAAQVQKMCESLSQNLAAIQKEPVPDEELKEMFDVTEVMEDE